MEIEKIRKMEQKEVVIYLNDGTELQGVISDLKETRFTVDETTAMGDMVVLRYEEVESLKEVKKMRYLGSDSWSRPVYKDEQGKLWKDTDPRKHVPPSICSALNNEFEGEPDCPFLGVAVLLPERKTW